MKVNTSTSAFLYFIFFLSGVAGLGYEIVWIRMFAVGLGHEFPSLLAVVVAFFGGFALGAWGLDSRVSRSRVPGRWYAALEIAIGTWGLISVVAIPWANGQVALLTGTVPGPLRHWAIAFLVPFVVLLPATTAMGATLPAMDRFFSRLREDGHSVGGLYGANTLGAVTGTLVTTFLLVPAVGFRVTILILATVNLICAGAVLTGPFRTEEKRQAVHARIRGILGSFRLGATIFLTGLLGIAYEVLGVRVMGQVLENTVYSFGSALSIYLFGTALGAVAYQAIAPREGFGGWLTFLLQAISVSCLVGVLTLSHASGIYESVRLLLGGGFGGSVGAEMTLALLVFLMPSFFMGATFSHLAQAARQDVGGVGRALGLNTLGGALAPVLFGVLLLPILGAKLALVLVALGYLLCIPEFRPRRLALGAVSLALLPVLPSQLILVHPPPGGSVLAYREGIMAAVSVVADAKGHRLLKINNRFNMGGTASAFGEQRQAHIPLLLHPNPHRALFLGLGTGITFHAAAYHPDLEAECVELVPEVIDMLPFFRMSAGDSGSHEKLTVKVADARRYVRASRKKYDVIIADLFHPARDGSGSLYTLEHFLAIREKLAPAGLFCQWLPLYQLDLDMIQVIIRTFLEVFPETRAYLAHFNVSTPALALIGTVEPLIYPSDWFEQRVGDPELTRALARVGLRNGFSLFGCLVAGKEDLATFAGVAPFNTDDSPLVTYGAPRFIYRKRSSSDANLAVLLDAFRPPSLKAIVSAGSKAGLDFLSRLERYLSARDLYIRGESLRVKGLEAEAIDAYLASVRTSHDFRSGYAMVLVLAQRRAASDRDGARKILLDLEAANPSRPDARAVLNKL